MGFICTGPHTSRASYGASVSHSPTKSCHGGHSSQSLLLPLPRTPFPNEGNELTTEQQNPESHIG